MSEPIQAADFEPADVGRPWLVAAGVGAVIALAALSMAGLYLFYLPAARDEPVAVSRFAAPRLQVDPQAELRAFEKAQRERLETTRWRDRAAGRLVIPIETAMAAVAARGPQAYAPLPATAQEQRP